VSDAQLFVEIFLPVVKGVFVAEGSHNAASNVESRKVLRVSEIRSEISGMVATVCTLYASEPSRSGPIPQMSLF
jgi:hypothetical protein